MVTGTKVLEVVLDEAPPPPMRTELRVPPDKLNPDSENPEPELEVGVGLMIIPSPAFPDDVSDGVASEDWRMVLALVDWRIEVVLRAEGEGDVEEGLGDGFGDKEGIEDGVFSASNFSKVLKH